MPLDEASKSPSTMSIQMANDVNAVTQPLAHEVQVRCCADKREAAQIEFHRTGIATALQDEVHAE